MQTSMQIYISKNYHYSFLKLQALLTSLMWLSTLGEAANVSTYEVMTYIITHTSPLLIGLQALR